MNEDEKIAGEHLADTYPGIGIDYEPDGNVPPDFVLGLHPPVAIEVRRLNENYLPEREIVEMVEGERPERLEGLEQAQYQLSKHLEKVCPKVKRVGDKQYYLHADLLGRDALALDLNALTAAVLTDIYCANDGDRFTTNHGGFNLEWSRFSSTKNPDAVLPGLYMDHESGGWSSGVYERNLQAVIDEKAWKVEHNAKPIYQKWWLILVDHIFPGSSFIRQFEPNLDLKAFDRVLVIGKSGELLASYP